MDLTTKMVNSVVENWPLVAAIAWGYWWLTPKVIKSALNNGSGEIIRGIVRSENATQTEAHKRELDNRFTKHEEAEDRRFRAIEEKVFKRRA